VTSGFKRKLHWTVIVGFFGGGILGLIYDLYRSNQPKSWPVRSDELRVPSGYVAEPPPADVPTRSLAGSWRHDDSKILVVRVKGGPIDQARLESLRGKVAGQLPGATIDRAEVRPVSDQQAAIVEASATRPDGTIAHLRWAIVGGSQHGTLVEQTSTSKTDDVEMFRSIVMVCGNVMSHSRFGQGAPFDSWLIRGAFLGMLLGFAIERYRTARATAKAAELQKPASATHHN
jgi:hypothetical protein